jgi:hypothetical protein
VTANQLLIKLVPRHSYTSDNLYLDGKNRAVLRLLRPQRNPTLNTGFYSPASMRSATFTHFIAGPLWLIQTFTALYITPLRTNHNRKTISFSRDSTYTFTGIGHLNKFHMARQLLQRCFYQTDKIYLYRIIL